MCVDGLKQEQLLVGSGYIDLISGTGFQVAASEVGLTEISSTAVDADTNTLSSGSRWVVFRNAFTGTPWVAVGARSTGRTAQGANTDFSWIGVGSIAPGSVLILGSVAGGAWTFDWIAAGSR